ncbi:hypothetical protein Tco_0964581 [Tanacetum coccineum]
MADNRTMAQMLQAPIKGYEDAIVVPPINANNFELKQPLINLVQSNKFTGRQDPHNHLRFFNKVTSTFRHPEVPDTSSTHKSTWIFRSLLTTIPFPASIRLFLLSLPTLTLFDESDFLLFEEADAFIAIDDEPVSPVFNATYYDPEGDILILGELLNKGSITIHRPRILLPGIQKELKVGETKRVHLN